MYTKLKSLLFLLVKKKKATKEKGNKWDYIKPVNSFPHLAIIIPKPPPQFKAISLPNTFQTQMDCQRKKIMSKCKFWK